MGKVNVTEERLELTTVDKSRRLPPGAEALG
jgi:hypothetical protein